MSLLIALLAACSVTKPDSVEPEGPNITESEGAKWIHHAGPGETGRVKLHDDNWQDFDKAEPEAEKDQTETEKKDSYIAPGETFELKFHYPNYPPIDK